MIITGQIIENNDGQILISASVPNYLIEKQNITTVEIEIVDGRNITRRQQMKFWAIMGDFADYTGYDPDQARQLFELLYMAKTGCDYFSLSAKDPDKAVDMTTASDFIQFVVDYCLEHSIPIKDALDRSPDIGRYLYMCLATRTCCLCGKKAEVHLTRDGAVALCRSHRLKAIDTPDFMELNHIWTIRLDEYLRDKLNLKG